MKRKYQTPQITIHSLPCQDIVCTSNIEGSGEGSEYGPDIVDLGIKHSPKWGLVTLLSLALISCTSSDEIAEVSHSLQGPQSDLVEMCFRASTEGENTTEQEQTRAAFASKDANGEIHSLWQGNDKISILYTTSSNTSNNKEFTIVEEKGLSHGIFSGKANLSPSQFTALYPYQSQAMYGTETSNVVLPTWQNATPGSFDPHAGLLMGQTANPDPPTTQPVLDIDFKHVCSYIELTPTFDCDAIIVATRSSDEFLAGNCYLQYNETPILSVNIPTKKTGLVNQVTLRGPIAKGQTYYIAVLPGTYSSGIRITCVGENGKMVTKQRSSAVTLERGKHHRMNAFLADPATAEVDGVDLGTGDGVLWATRNLGATTPLEYGDKYAWGESTPLYSYTIDSENVTLYKAKNPTANEYDRAATPNDPATSSLGSVWRMPTKTEMEKLRTKCTWEYVENYNGTGISGYTVKGNNNQIFFPTSINPTYYWTSDKDDNQTSFAYRLIIDRPNDRQEVSSGPGYTSSFIRPVRNSNN